MCKIKKLYQRKETEFMPNILPVSDLRNYNEILKIVWLESQYF